MGDTEVLAATKKAKKVAAVKHTLTLHFQTAEEIDLYHRLEEMAKNDYDRPLPRYAVIVLRAALAAPAPTAEPNK